MPSPYAYTVYTSTTSGQTDFQFTWPYIKEEHVKLYVNYNEISQGSGSSQFQVITNVSPKLVRLNTGLSSANLRVEVRRISSLDTPLVDYADGSTLTATDLDTSSLQSLYIAQELDDNQSRNVAIDTSTALPSLNNQRLTNVSNPTAAQDAATKSYVDTNDALQLSRSGGTMTGDIVTGGNRITGLPNPASASEPVTKSYFEGQSWSGSDTLESTDTWASNNSKIATTGAIDGRIDSVIESDVLAGTDLAKTASGGQVTINHSVSGANSTVNNSDGNVLQDITISAQGHVTAIGSTNLDSRYYTETELSTGGVLDGRYYTKTSADSTFYKLGSAGEIQSGETWSSSDSKVATTAAIDARITDLVDDVGGFVPIASETNFPTANPDVNNGAGTLLSIKEIGTTRTPSSGTVTIANGSGSNTVTITGCGSTVLTAGFGVIVETTSTLHTYSFHRLTPKATEVTTVAGISANITTVAGNTTNINSVASNATNINSVAGISSNVTTVAGISSNVTSVAGNETNINAVNSNSTNINLVAGSISNVNTVGGSIANVNTVATNISGVNSFGERYRVASSDPTSDLDEGDLVFNTTTNQLRVYNGSAWQGGVTATGDLIAKTGDTFSGAIGIIAGTTGSPGLYISGDTDTGIHSPGANTIALIASGSNILQAGSSGITVNGTATIDGDVTLTGAANNVVWDKSDNALEFADNAKATFGTGIDLEIYSDGTNAFIQCPDTGNNLTIESDNHLWLKVADSDFALNAGAGGGVSLYYNGVKTFETKSNGVIVQGTEGQNAELLLYADEGDDDADKWRIKSDTAGSFEISNYASGSYEKNIECNGNGNVELYYDGVKKLETKSTGISISSGQRECNLTLQNDARTWKVVNYDYGNDGTDYLGFHDGTADRLIIQHDGHVHLPADSQQLVFGTGDDLKIYHDGNHSYIKDTGTGNLKIDGSDNVELQAGGSTKAYTYANGLFVYDQQIPDDGVLNIGNGSDLQIYHASNNSRITHGGAGNLIIETTATDSDLYLRGKDKVVIQPNDGSDGVICNAASSTELYYNNSKKFETLSTGAKVTGDLHLNDNAYIKLGASNDLVMRHEAGGSANITYAADQGNFYIGADDVAIRNSAQSKWKAKFITDGAVELYYDNDKKFETTNTGILISGDVSMSSELNLTGGPGEKYIDTAHLNHTLHFRRISGGDADHTNHCTVSSAGVWSADFNDTSDEKLKENITTISDGAISEVKQLRPVTFDWKETDKANNVSGFIAQEVKTVLPNLVYGTEYDPTVINESQGIKSTGYSVNTIGIVAHLTKALQEAITKIETLETKVAALEAE